MPKGNYGGDNMSKPILPCRFCGKSLVRVKSRIIVDEGRGGRKPRHWSCCRDCMDTRQFQKAIIATMGYEAKVRPP